MTDAPDPDAGDQLALLVRTEGARVLATLTRTVGDLQLAEDSVQDAIVTALQRWPVTGIPDNPRAWLAVAARNRAIDVIRRESRRPDKEVEALQLTAGDPAEVPDSVLRDDLLRLIFTCCHPAIALDAQVALSLRTLCGLSTAEIGRALLVPEPTMAKRLVRAKQKIAVAAIPYRVPEDHELPERLPGVLAVAYLVFTEGHRATSGDALLRVDLCDEAIRLTRLLADLMPGEPEVLALLALMLLADARRETRVDDDGDIVLMRDQDRALWDRAEIVEGLALVDESLRRSPDGAGYYLLQAELAAAHAGAATYAATPWPVIVDLYDQLSAAYPSPIVRLNRAAAIAERDGPLAGLAEVDAIDELNRLPLWHSVRGELLTRAGRIDEAADALGAALSGDMAAPERRLVERRLAALSI